MDVSAWLQSLGLERYMPAFRDNEIDWDALPKLSAEDLKDLGVVLGGHPWSVERPGGRLVRELANGVGDPAPHGLAAVIVLRGEVVPEAPKPPKRAYKPRKGSIAELAW
jgi:hypothetical protein